MPKEDGISQYKGPMRRAKPNQKALYTIKCPTMRAIARCRLQPRYEHLG